MSNLMKPIIIVPPDTISEEGLKDLRDNGLCVVVAKEPASVKLLDPIVSMAARSRIEEASFQLSRRILHTGYVSNTDAAKLFVDILTKGTPLQNGPTEEEKAQMAARLDEARKIGREEAREEARVRREAKKAAEKAK